MRKNNTDTDIWATIRGLIGDDQADAAWESAWNAGAAAYELAANDAPID